MSSEFRVCLAGEDEDDALTVKAYDEGEAAERFCELTDEGDSPDTQQVKVRGEFGVALSYTVHKSYSVDFTAYPDDDPKEGT